MVPGLDSFREKFKNYTDYYTIIGGTACDILLSEADLPFRATKDIDMILIMEDNFPEFASIFWEYIKEGGYKCGWKNEQNMHFYRFTEGKFGYPTMIELFSRKPGYLLEIEEGIIPIHIDDDTSSLSAILLNDDYYKFMMSGRRVVDGIGVLGAEHLIPFKMYAWINLLERKRAGEHVNEKDLKKHKYDVFRLLQIVTAGTKVESEGLVTESIHRYIEEISVLDAATMDWIDSFTKKGQLKKLPNTFGGYSIKIFDNPELLDMEIQKRAKESDSALSRVIATYDWEYSSTRKPMVQDHLVKYWEVLIGKWHKPWNRELESELTRKEKRDIKGLAWAEQPKTINEVGSTFTIQGFDLNYAGVILGPSVKYRDGKIIFDPSASHNEKAVRNRTLSDGTKKKFGETLIQHEVRVLMTRGVNGMYIYACDPELRAALLAAAK